MLCFILINLVYGTASLKVEDLTAGSSTSLKFSMESPDFAGPIKNVTVAIGREAVLSCSVTDLGHYKSSDNGPLGKDEVPVGGRTSMPPYIVKIHLAPHYGNDYAAPAKQPSLIINYKIITPFPFWGRAPAGLLTRAASLRSVGWMKADDQTILSLHTRVITHNPRISVTHDDSLRTWQLRIRQLKESDRGCYMCQINTGEMKKQLGCVDVQDARLVPVCRRIGKQESILRKQTEKAQSKIGKLDGAQSDC
ncbi:hypothetical protein GEV33_010261 [Tenebrio molitor]|uniref:Ig-like domain-containing protein n=1 Tax=Tenebrio molitor TaxID=7067 RepID=A0A8J6L918_TENMO|nr:hypothetical protein GEV33_010261 [Tenebrio molitor]